MRIISGTHKGRNIVTPNNLDVRPTTDFAKESLFNILFNYMDFEGLEVLDLFAGTGGISYEFASRGCARVVAVDNNFKCVNFIKQSAVTMKLNAIHALEANMFNLVKFHNAKYDVIFADPPYNMPHIEKVPSLIFEHEMLKNNGWFVFEHSNEFDFKDHPKFFQQRDYGKVNFSFFVNNLEELGV